MSTLHEVASDTQQIKAAISSIAQTLVGMHNTMGALANTQLQCPRCGADKVTMTNDNPKPWALSESQNDTLTRLVMSLASREKIEAIKAYRELTGCGLKEGLNFVERFEAVKAVRGQGID